MIGKYDWPANSKWISDVANYHQSIAFDAAGNRYACVCGIISDTGDHIAIDNDNINHFEWTNEVNNVCLTGFAEIVDTTGRLGEVFSKYFCHLVFEIDKFADNAKRTDGQFEDTSMSSSVFRHVFIVNNAEIVRRTRQFVIYRLYLIGLEWYGLAKNILFSNFDMKIPEGKKSDKLSDSLSEFIPGDFGKIVGNAVSKIENSSLMKGMEKLTAKVNALAAKFGKKSGGGSSGGSSEESPTEVFAIIQSLLAAAFTNTEIYDSGNKPGIDDASFEAFKSNVDVHACFGYDFTIVDSIKFLLNKLYYNEFSGDNLLLDSSLKMLVYDEFKNKYGLIRYGADSDFISATDGDPVFIGTWESLFGSSFESLTNPIEQDLKSVVDKSAVESFKSFFKRVYHYFTLAGFKQTSIESEKIMEYSGQQDTFPPNSEFQSYAPKMDKKSFEKFFSVEDPKKENYDVHGSQWSNDFTLYLDQVTNLISRDVLVLHTKGDITHRPGMKFGIVDDSAARNDMESSSLDSKRTSNASKEIIGAFNVVKVTHVVKPNSKKRDNFTEKLYLSRNFIADKK